MSSTRGSVTSPYGASLTKGSTRRGSLSDVVIREGPSQTTTLYEIRGIDRLIGRKRHIAEPNHRSTDPVEKLWESRGRYYRDPKSAHASSIALNESLGVKSAVDSTAPPPPLSATLDDLGMRAATYQSRANKDTVLSTSVQVGSLIKQESVVKVIQECPGFIPPTSPIAAASTGRMLDRVITMPNAPSSPARRNSVSSTINQLHMRGAGAGDLIRGVDPATGGIINSPNRSSSVPASPRRHSRESWLEDRSSTVGYGRKYAENELTTSRENPLADPNQAAVNPQDAFPRGWGLHGVHTEAAGSKRPARTDAMYDSRGIVPGGTTDDRLGPWQRRHNAPVSARGLQAAEVFHYATAEAASAAPVTTIARSNMTVQSPAHRRNSLTGSPKGSGYFAAHSSSSSYDNPLSNPEIVPNQRVSRDALFGGRTGEGVGGFKGGVGSGRTYHYETNLRGEGAATAVRPDAVAGMPTPRVRRDQQSNVSIFG